MKPILAAALAAGLLFAPAAHGQEAAEEKEDGKDPDRVICRTEDRIGSRIAKSRTCMTAAQWEEVRRQSRVALDRYQANRWKQE